jgi:hypothetical protein
MISFYCTHLIRNGGFTTHSSADCIFPRILLQLRRLVFWITDILAYILSDLLGHLVSENSGQSIIG